MPEMRRPEPNRLPDRRERAVQEKIADLKVRAGRIITAVKLIAGAAALLSFLEGMAEIMSALKEELAGRTIDSEK